MPSLTAEHHHRHVEKGNADVRLAWSPEGVYGAASVRDSKVVNRDPTRFWTGDVLELFLAADEKSSPHQFWFVPMPMTQSTPCSAGGRTPGPSTRAG